MLSPAAAVSFLNRKLAPTQGVAIAYTCAKTGAVLTLTAVRGKSLVTVQDGYGAILQIPSTDWLVQASYLASLGSGSYTPAKGDRVTAPDGLIYELMTPSYTPSDHAGLRLRLHSVRVPA